MCRKLVCLISLVSVLALGSSTSAKLVAHYKFDGDYTNSADPCGLTGKAYGDAKIVADPNRGQVLSLDGTDDYLYIGNDDIGSISTAVTLAAWIKTDSLGASDTIVGKGYNWRLYSGYGSNAGKAVLQCMDTSPAKWVAGSVNLSDGKWHHIAATYDGQVYKLYLDGVQDGNSVSATGPIKSFYADTFCIGAFYKSTNTPPAKRFFNGLIDDVRVYDDAQTAEQIRSWAAIPEKKKPQQKK